MMTPIFIGRWTPKILFSLQAKPYRQGELRRRLQGSPSGCLPELCAVLNLQDRSPGATTSKPLAVEYSLTQQGKTIIAPLPGMCRWGQAIPHEGKRWNAPSKNLTRTYP